MKKYSKKIISIILAPIILWGIIFFIDYTRCGNFKEPIFVIAGKAEEKGKKETYYGLGYKVETEKTNVPGNEPTLVKIEMYILDKFIVGAIAETDNGSTDEEKQKIEEEQYEFIATIIEVYDETMLVKPEEETKEIKSSDKIIMKINRTTNETKDFYKAGNKVKITYNGNIMESYPAQINATKVELVK